MEMSSWENDLQANFLNDVESEPMIFFADVVESDQIMSPTGYSSSVSTGSAEGSSEGASSKVMTPPVSASVIGFPIFSGCTLRTQGCGRVY